MTWWCPMCEDTFEQPTDKGECALCGYWGIQDEDGVLWVQRNPKIPVVLQDGFRIWRLGAYASGWQEIEIACSIAFREGCQQVGVHYPIDHPIYFTSMTDLIHHQEKVKE